MDASDDEKQAMIEVGRFLKRNGFDRFNTEVLQDKLGYPVAGFQRIRLRVVIGPRWTTMYRCRIAGGVFEEAESVPTAYTEKIADDVLNRLKGERRT